MSEIDLNEARGRLRSMAGGSLTWDLSVNDRTSIGVVLAELARLEHLLSLAPTPTVSPEEHRRVQAEAAAMRRALEERSVIVSDWGRWCVLCGVSAPHALAFVHGSRCALSSSAGSALLEEMEGLRKENAALENERDCARADLASEKEKEEATRSLLVSVRENLNAESADLRARLERATAAREDACMSDQKPVDWMLSMGRTHLMVAGTVVATEGDLCRDEAVRTEQQEAEPNHWRAWDGDSIRSVVSKAQDAIAAEVRRAVEVETERIVAVLRARAREWGADTAVGHALEVAAAAIRSRS